MCGITGFISPKLPDASAVINAMNGALAHRGPDASRAWLDPSYGLGIGHRRLAIIDLSPAAEQPMVSESGRYILAFNGEIYNFKELKARLESRASVPQRLAGAA